MKRRAYVNTKTSTLQHVLEASWNVRRFGVLELKENEFTEEDSGNRRRIVGIIIIHPANLRFLSLK